MVNNACGELAGVESNIQGYFVNYPIHHQDKWEMGDVSRTYEKVWFVKTHWFLDKWNSPAGMQHQSIVRCAKESHCEDAWNLMITARWVSADTRIIMNTTNKKDTRFIHYTILNIDQDELEETLTENLDDLQHLRGFLGQDNWGHLL